MPDLITAFNAEEYGWKDLQVMFLGRPVIGLRGLRFKESQEKTNVYGAGKKPVARTRGNVMYEGEVKVLLSELVAMLQSQGNNAKGVMSIPPFDIAVSFAPDEGGVITSFSLVYCEFTENEVNLNQGDQQVEITLPIIIGDIKWNI